MTPLFAVPDSPDIIAPSGRQDTRAPARGGRPNSRPGGSGHPAKPRKEPPDLLTVTAERLRRALGRSFLRYGVSGDVDRREFVAFWLGEGRVLAGMNVNVWDVNDAIQALVSDGRPMDPARLSDPGVPLEEVAG